MLSVRNVTKRYGRIAALDGVSFELEPGRVLAVIGSNGAGKSTLIKAVMGLVHAEGEILVDGVNVARNPKAARRKIGYLPQTSTLPPDMSVQEAAVLYAQLKGVGEDRARLAVERAGLMEHADRRVGELSGGMNQRLSLAIARLAEPPMLVLDEPVSGLDVSARLDLRHLIQEQRAAGTSVLLSTHWLEDVPHIADDVLLLDQGKTVYLGPATRLATGQAAASKLFLRLNGSTPRAIPLLQEGGAAQSIGQSGDWLVVSCPPDAKARIVEALVGAGISILDFRVEEAPVSEAIARIRRLEEVEQ